MYLFINEDHEVYKAPVLSANNRRLVMLGQLSCIDLTGMRGMNIDGTFSDVQDMPDDPPNFMTFSQALDLLKKGAKVARKNWNGKGMFICLELGTYDFIGRGSCGDVGGVDADLFGDGCRGQTTRMPCINMNAADGAMVVGWLASQTDLLASDWVLVP